MHKKWWCLARVADFLSCISYFLRSSHVASLVRLTLVHNISQSSPINLGSFYSWINDQKSLATSVKSIRSVSWVSLIICEDQL